MRTGKPRNLSFPHHAQVFPAHSSRTCAQDTHAHDAPKTLVTQDMQAVPLIKTISFSPRVWKSLLALVLTTSTAYCW